MKDFFEVLVGMYKGRELKIIPSPSEKEQVYRHEVYSRNRSYLFHIAYPVFSGFLLFSILLWRRTPMEEDVAWNIFVLSLISIPVILWFAKVYRLKAETVYKVFIETKPNGIKDKTRYENVLRSVSRPDISLTLFQLRAFLTFLSYFTSAVAGYIYSSEKASDDFVTAATMLIIIVVTTGLLTLIGNYLVQLKINKFWVIPKKLDPLRPC